MVCSLDKKDAISLAQKALEGKGWNLNDYPSFKKIKGRKVKREVGGMRYGKKYVQVNCSLDWTDYEWRDLLDVLQGQNK